MENRAGRRQTRTAGLVIGRVGGAPIILTPSWFLFAALIAYLYGSILVGPGAPAWAMGLALGVVMFVTVLVHELAHGLAGRLAGSTPREYVLSFFGGHTAFVTRERSSWAAAAVSAAGPLSNLALGALAWLAAELLALPGPAEVVARAAAVINVIMALFNLLPGLPLDGGRIVLEVVEALTGRRRVALLVTGWLGRLVGVAGIAWVLLGWDLDVTSPSFFRSVGFFALLWAGLIALMLWQGSRPALAEARRTRRGR